MDTLSACLQDTRELAGHDRAREPTAHRAGRKNVRKESSLNLKRGGTYDGC